MMSNSGRLPAEEPWSLSLSLEASSLGTEGVFSPREQPYFCELNILLLGEVEAESMPRMTDRSLELSEHTMWTMEPRQAH